MSTIRTLTAVAAFVVLAACAQRPATPTITPATEPEVTQSIPGVLPTPEPEHKPHAWNEVDCVGSDATRVLPDTYEAWTEAREYCARSKEQLDNLPWPSGWSPTGARTVES